MASMAPVSRDWARRAQADFSSEAIRRVARNAVTGEGISKAARDITRLRREPSTYTVSLRSATTITNQHSTGRCWLFSTYNPLRARTMAILDVDDFEFSQAYGQFYDKLEKANAFLQWVWETAGEDWESREVTRLMESPIPDGGMWAWGANLTEKWGMVPKHVMGETACSEASREMNQVLGRLLRARAVELRGLVDAGAGDSAVEALIERSLGEVHSILCTCLGEPPDTFDLVMEVGPDAKVDRDLLTDQGPTEGPGAPREAKARRILRDPDLTPQAFQERYVGFSMDDHVELVSFPMEELPYYEVFSVIHGDPCIGGRPGRYLNVPAEVLQAAAIASLEGGEACYLACDVGQMSPRALKDFPGVLAVDSMDLDDILGCSLAMGRDAMYRSRESSLTHAMTLQGVDLDADGRPLAWRVENSWGSESCDAGFYRIDGSWFDIYVADLVVNRRFLDQRTLEAWVRAEADPSRVRWLEPWGYLAACVGMGARL